MNPERLNEIKDLQYKVTEGMPYGLCIATLVLKLMPEKIKAKLILPEDMSEPVDENDVRVNKNAAITYLSNMLPKIIPEDKFRELCNETKEKMDKELEEIYALLTIESIVDAANETNVRMIAEADTEEEVKDTVKDLGEMLEKDEIPNILSVIATTVSKEIQKSNKELEKIEDTETELIVKTDPNVDVNASFNSLEDDEDDIDPEDTGDDLDAGDNPETTPEGSDNGDNSDDTDEGDTDDKEEDENKEEVPTGLEGEDGELYTESVVNKYREQLEVNLVYRVKNAISKYIHSMIKETEGEQDITPGEKAGFVLVTYGAIVLGYILDELDLIDIKDFAEIVEEKLSYNHDGSDNNAY